MTKPKTPEAIFAQFPELATIAERLQKSEEETNKINEAAEKKEPAAEGGTTTFHDEAGKKTRERRVYPEHFLVTHYLKGNQWKKTAYVPDFGRDNFLSVLSNLINAIDAEDAFNQYADAKLEYEEKGEKFPNTPQDFLEGIESGLSPKGEDLSSMSDEELMKIAGIQ